MTVRFFSALIPFLLFAPTPASVQAQAGAASTPNLVFILADDLGWADLACYGSDLHETPNLDRLARQGVRFTQAYSASPVCSPTRASILTGRHPARLRMTIWRENAQIRGNRKLLEPVTLDSLPLEETTLAEILQGAGYATAHIGKWHLGRAEAYPQPHGFDVNIGGTLWGAPQTFFYPYKGEQYFRDWRYVPDLEPGKPGDYLTDALTDKAIEIIDRHAGKKPFFVNLWYHTVHTPIEGKPDVVAKYRNKIQTANPARHRNPDYAAMVESLDENVGRVLDALDRAGVAGNTLVVFFSDNGGFINECKLHRGHPVTNNAPLRSGKGSCYEGGIRVPLIIFDPRIHTTNDRAASQTPVYSCDLLPTLAELMNVDATVAANLDGLSLAKLVRDPSATLSRTDLFFHYPHYYPTTTPVSAVRSGDWKLLEYYEDGRRELYDLKTDLSESKDLSKVRPELATRLHQRLQQWRLQVKAQTPERNPARSDQ